MNNDFFIPQFGKPVYKQLYDSILEKICYGEMAVGDALPTYTTLKVEYKISTRTIAQTYKVLKKEGYIAYDKQKRKMIVIRGADEAQEYRRRMQEISDEIKIALSMRTDDNDDDAVQNMVKNILDKYGR